MSGKPQRGRTCVGCRTVSSKHELLRIVRHPNGDVDVDGTGRAPGRGAYICRQVECLERALAGMQLERALKRNVPNDIVDRMREAIRSK